MIKKLWPFTRNYRKFLLITPVMMIGEVLMETLIPLLMGKIVDVGIAGAIWAMCSKSAA